MIIITEKMPHKPRLQTDDRTYKEALNVIKNPPVTWAKYDLNSWDHIAEILKMETDELENAIKTKDLNKIHENIIHTSAVLMLMEKL